MCSPCPSSSSATWTRSSRRCRRDATNTAFRITLSRIAHWNPPRRLSRGWPERRCPKGGVTFGGAHLTILTEPVDEDGRLIRSDPRHAGPHTRTPTARCSPMTNATLQDAETFDEYRPLLFAIAYRML